MKNRLMFAVSGMMVSLYDKNEEIEKQLFDEWEKSKDYPKIKKKLVRNNILLQYQFNQYFKEFLELF
jgi:hypothetical protein